MRLLLPGHSGLEYNKIYVQQVQVSTYRRQAQPANVEHEPSRAVHDRHAMPVHKSGTNTFRGGFFTVYSPPGLERDGAYRAVFGEQGAGLCVFWFEIAGNSPVFIHNPHFKSESDLGTSVLRAHGYTARRIVPEEGVLP